MKQIHQEFGTLFAMKIAIFFTELLSVLLTPFILWFSLPPCAGAIIDFFREFTVHVDGVGYVCSFAVFDFRRHEKTQAAPTGEVADAGRKEPLKAAGLDPRIGALLGGQPAPRQRPTPSAHPATYKPNTPTDNKMEKSFLHFKATHPDWQPDPSSSIFLDKLVSQHQQYSRFPGPGLAGDMRSPPFGTSIRNGKRGAYGHGMAGSVYGAGGGGRGLGLGGGATGSVYGGSMAGSIFGEQDIRSRGAGEAGAVGGMAGALANRRSRSKVNGDMLSPPPALGRMEEGEDGAEDADALAGYGVGAEWDTVPGRGRQMGHGAYAVQPNGRGEHGEDNGEGERDRFMRDAGLVGILQQIVSTGGGMGR